MAEGESIRIRASKLDWNGEGAMLDRLNAHRAWANGLYVEWIQADEAREEYCVKMLSHVLRAEDTWLIRLRGEVPENKIWTLLSPEEMRPMRLANDAGWSAALSGAWGDLDRVLRYRRLDGTEMESSIADIASHVFMHGMYHRGQIAARAAQAGLPKVPGSDFIVFARL
jgi:uncharacterized damage-inducible protein DinB